MNKSGKLIDLDCMCDETIKSHNIKGRTQVQKEMNMAIYYYTNFGNTKGFTRNYISPDIIIRNHGNPNDSISNKSARIAIEELSKEDIDMEMFLNIIKVAALKNYRHEATLFKVKEDCIDQFSNDEFELWAYEVIKNPNNSMGKIRAYFDANPKMYEKLVFSFVFRRYFDHLHTRDELDNPNIMSPSESWEYANLQNKVEGGYNKPKTY